MFIRTLPIIRHIRAFLVIRRYIWKAVWIWDARTVEEIPAWYQKDREHARNILKGEE